MKVLYKAVFDILKDTLVVRHENVIFVSCEIV